MCFTFTYNNLRIFFFYLECTCISSRIRADWIKLPLENQSFLSISIYKFENIYKKKEIKI